MHAMGRGNRLLLGDEDCVVGDGSRAILVTSHGCNLNNSERYRNCLLLW